MVTSAPNPVPNPRGSNWIESTRGRDGDAVELGKVLDRSHGVGG